MPHSRSGFIYIWRGEAMAFDSSGTCSGCYEIGYEDAFETVIEHFKNSKALYSGNGEAIAAEVAALLKIELPYSARS